jgi:hypothetical protein
MDEFHDEGPQISDKAPRTQAAIYTGPLITGRGIDEIDRSFLFRIDREGQPATFDVILLSHLERVKSEGRNEFTLIDIGSGKGSLLAGILSETKSVQRSRKFFADNPDFMLRIRGLTDSPSPDKHNKETELAVDEESLTIDDREVNRRIDAQNIHWSLTRNQTLNAFCTTHGVENIDLAMATESLMYLPLPIFREVLEATLARMKPGAQLITTAIAGAPPGFAEVNQRFNHILPPGGEAELWKDLIRKPTLLTSDGFEHSREDEEAAVGRAISFYKNLGALTDTDIAARTAQIESYFVGTESEDAKRRMISSALLERGFNNLIKMKRRGEWLKKLDIVNSLPNVSVEIFSYSGHGDEKLPRGLILTKA